IDGLQACKFFVSARESYTIVILWRCHRFVALGCRAPLRHPTSALRLARQESSVGSRRAGFFSRARALLQTADAVRQTGRNTAWGIQRGLKDAAMSADQKLEKAMSTDK